MAQAFASRMVEAPVEAVWAVVRDFDGLPNWVPAVTDSMIEDGRDADVVGCVRSFHLQGGAHVRERLLALDDSRYALSYNFETPAFPVENYVATLELIPDARRDATYVSWRATFDEAPEDKGKYVRIVSQDVFAAGLAALAEKLRGAAAPEGAVRWQGFRPAKVFAASVIGAPVDVVWARMRDFAGMDGWHADITRMSMRDGVRSDKVSGVRDFFFGPGALWEQLTYLSDPDRAFRYRILKSELPLLNYHAGARLHEITATNETFAVWTADWTATPEDDQTLIPAVRDGVFHTAFDTLHEQLAR
jgi:uncharacterized protein YndB with AHSA1/START domain